MTGCGTLYGRRGYIVEKGAYPATRTDAKRLFNSSRHDFSPLIDIVAFPFWFIDLPISLVTDTVMISHDLKQDKESNQTKEAIASPEAGQAQPHR